MSEAQPAALAGVQTFPQTRPRQGPLEVPAILGVDATPECLKTRLRLSRRLSQRWVRAFFSGESGGRSVVAEALPGSIVELDGDVGDVRCGVDGQVSSLRVVLARKPV